MTALNKPIKPSLLDIPLKEKFLHFYAAGMEDGFHLINRNSLLSPEYRRQYSKGYLHGLLLNDFVNSINNHDRRTEI